MTLSWNVSEPCLYSNETPRCSKLTGKHATVSKQMWSQYYREQCCTFSFPSFVSALISYVSHSSPVNPHPQCRVWVGRIWRSLCPGSVQLSVSHVYIIEWAVGVLRHWPVKRNAVTFPTLNLCSYMSHIVFKKVYWLVCFALALKARWYHF